MLLGCLPLGDVDVDAAVTNRDPTIVPDHPSAAKNQSDGPIGSTDAVLAVVVSPAPLPETPQHADRAGMEAP